ncbi:MAG: hypothetical protein MUF54_19840 [Polyangiaceae bacterium]|jgi:hypothetical protein|nr:hypothetical protein [Polyangiaceae bacterium]
MPSENTLPTTVNEERSFALAFAESDTDRNALRPEDVKRVNLDVPSAVATSLGALPEILALRSEVEARLPKFDIGHFDRLQSYTMALSHAFAQSKSSIAELDKLPELNVEGTTIRDNFLADMATLARRGLINPKTFKTCKGYTGYKNIATELQVLSNLARAHWTGIEGKCGICLEELDRADKIAAHMLRLVGLREQAPEIAAEAADERDRAFTLFMRNYDQVRRAVTYLRWDEDDADEIAPSLYAGRRRSGTDSKKEEPAPVVVTPAPNAGVPAEPIVPPVTPASPAVPTGGPFVD